MGIGACPRVQVLNDSTINHDIYYKTLDKLFNPLCFMFNICKMDLYSRGGKVKRYQ